MGKRALVAVCLVLALVLAVSASACSPPPRSGRPSKAVKPATPVPVPDVVGKNATEAVDALDEALGSTVTVEVYSATRHGTIAIEEPDPRRSNESTVTTQVPAAGALVKTGRRIRIFVGPPPSGDEVPEGAGHGWFYHPANVKNNGAEPCFECHYPSACGKCHTNLAGKGLL